MAICFNLFIKDMHIEYTDWIMLSNRDNKHKPSCAKKKYLKRTGNKIYLFVLSSMTFQICSQF